MKRTRKLLTAMMTAAVVATGATTAMADGAKIFVIGGKADDPFGRRSRRAPTRCRQGRRTDRRLGDLARPRRRNYDNLGPDAAKLIRTALSQKPSAIVGPDWVPVAHGRRLQGSRCRRRAAHHLQFRRHGRRQAARRHELCWQ